MTAGDQPEVSQLNYRGRSVFNYCFTKVVLGRRGGIKLVIVVEDSNTVGPSSITIMMEYLFALQF